MASSEVEQKIQAILVRAHALLNELREVTKDDPWDLPDRVEFMGGYIHFGIDGVPAHGGPVFNHEWWSASSFECWPTDEQRTWMYGPNRDDWPPTSYEDDY